jgi:hypothetical protein
MTTYGCVVGGLICQSMSWTRLDRQRWNSTLCVEQFDQLDEVGERACQPVDLVDDDHVDPSRSNIVEQFLEGGSVHGAAGVAAIVIAVADQPPAFVGLALDVGFGWLGAGVQLARQSAGGMLGRDAGVDGAAQGCLAALGLRGDATSPPSSSKSWRSRRMKKRSSWSSRPCVSALSAASQAARKVEVLTPPSLREESSRRRKSCLFDLIQGFDEVIVQVRIVHKSADGLLAEQRGFVEAAIPVLGREIALTDANRKTFSSPGTTAIRPSETFRQHMCR